MLTEFSDLPEDVIEDVLSRIPLRDSIRTSILSKKWRHYWTKIQSLKLGGIFFYTLLDRGLPAKMRVAEYVNIVGNIMLSHKGSIRLLHLHVPDFGKDTPPPDDIDNWILSVSQRGVQDLFFQYEYITDDPADRFFEFPLSVFQCVELKHLRLWVTELDIPPQNFGKLGYLVSLDLRCEWVSADMLTNMVLNCPLLQNLWLTLDHTHFQNGPFVLTAPKLKLLSVSYYFYRNFILKDTLNISTLSLSLDGFPELEDAPYKCQDVVHFFHAISEVENVNLNGYVLGEWAEQHVPEKLPVPLDKHLSLSVYRLDIDSLAEIRSLFCLIKSSPRLTMLQISMTRPYEPLYDAREYEYLQSHINGTKNLWSLRTVKLSGFVESGLGIVLIQVILSCCPMLEKLYLESSVIASLEAESKVMTDIMHLSRASTKAEIILITHTETTKNTKHFDANGILFDT